MKAIQDAYCLATELADVGPQGKHGGVAAALGAYERKRKEIHDEWQSDVFDRIQRQVKAHVDAIDPDADEHEIVMRRLTDLRMAEEYYGGANTHQKAAVDAGVKKLSDQRQAAEATRLASATAAAKRAIHADADR